MQYLQEGVFHYWLPPNRKIHWRDPMGKPGCDWFGINHYARQGQMLLFCSECSYGRQFWLAVAPMALPDKSSCKQSAVLRFPVA